MQDTAALLVAVVRAVQAGLTQRGVDWQRNGYSWWPTVGQVMTALGNESRTRIKWRDMYRHATARKLDQERLDKLLPPGTYAAAVNEILDGERAPAEVPSSAPPKKEWAPPPSRSEDPRERVEARKEQILHDHDRRVADMLVEQQSLTELLVEAVERGARTAEPVVWRPAPTVILTPDMQEEVPIILMSDIHGGAEIKPDEVGGLGEYNFIVFKRRLDAYLERIISILTLHRQSARIKKAVLNALGDMLEGEVIFDGQAHRIEMVTVDQMFAVAEYLVSWIQRLLSTGLIETLDVIAIFGNHGRTTHKKGATKAHANWDFVLYRYLAAVLQNEPRVKWFIPKAWFAVYEVLGWRLYCTHGDTIKAWMGIPFYGIQRHDMRTTTLLQMVHLDYQYHITADKHVAATIPRVVGAQIMNGSTVGGSDFSMHQLGTASEPMQTIFGINEKHGKTWQYDLVLERRDMEEVRKHLAFQKI